LNRATAPSEINATIRPKFPPCSLSIVVIASGEKDKVIPLKGVATAKTTRMNKKVPQGILIHEFCDPGSFGDDKLFIVDTANQTEKNINKTLVSEGAKHLKANC
jgi:hypothetical protein